MFFQEWHSESSELISGETLDIEARTHGRDSSRPINDCMAIYIEEVEDRLPENVFLSTNDFNFICERFSTIQSIKHLDIWNLCVRINGKTRRLWSHLDSWGFKARAGSYRSCGSTENWGKGMKAAGLAALYLGNAGPLATTQIIDQTYLIIVAR